jgi:hypothetical protein
VFPWASTGPLKSNLECASAAATVLENGVLLPGWGVGTVLTSMLAQVGFGECARGMLEVQPRRLRVL